MVRHVLPERFALTGNTCPKASTTALVRQPCLNEGGRCSIAASRARHYAGGRKVSTNHLLCLCSRLLPVANWRAKSAVRPWMRAVRSRAQQHLVSMPSRPILSPSVQSPNISPALSGAWGNAPFANALFSRDVNCTPEARGRWQPCEPAPATAPSRCRVRRPLH